MTYSDFRDKLLKHLETSRSSQNYIIIHHFFPKPSESVAEEPAFSSPFCRRLARLWLPHVGRKQAGGALTLKRKKQVRQADQSHVFRCLSSFEPIGQDRPVDQVSNNDTVQLEEIRDEMFLLKVYRQSKWPNEPFFHHFPSKPGRLVFIIFHMIKFSCHTIFDKY